MTTTIRNPRRLLILSPSTHSPSIIPPLLHSLTGVPVAAPPAATAPDTPPAGTQPEAQTETEIETETEIPTLSDADTLAPSSHSNASSTATIAPTPTPTPTPPPASAPEAEPPTTTTFAGYTTHPPLHIKNKYYTADIPIWVDEIPLSAPPTSSATAAATTTTTPPTTTATTPEPTTPQTWKTSFSSPEAQVVREAIGAVMICFRNPASRSIPLPLPNGDEDAHAHAHADLESREDVRQLKSFVQAVGEVRALIEEERGGLGVAEVPGVVVLVGGEGEGRGNGAGAGAGAGDGTGEEMLGEEPFSVGWWEDQVCEMGLIGVEVVRWDPKGDGSGDGEGRNVYGELQGMRRIKEVLETHDWAVTEGEDMGMGMGMGTGLLDDDDLERELLGLDEGEHGFDLEVNELEREMVGLRMAIERGGGDGFGFDDDEEVDDEELRVDAVEALLLRMRAIKGSYSFLPSFLPPSLSLCFFTSLPEWHERGLIWRPDISDELPETERKRFAAKAVRDIMKEL
ncbi:hypothetical protein BO70DRAFT_351176 [Aspergillus heteromorphus CBS 117.55]|uniref:Uncharacterized protein n=1 Tax=Aspergillus heteromorphus CBS 117.55 TaxID=1448321 RepID=A0A317WS20_9EURO|nr:uncharacterized protein BO70DRAFT_351176 [Aspergillus heteromorphus CBS 117.55]PWY87708.1 hypothetical protein BO70DRAFT_351176 [Aspergillus heteromorphus CBS 117.55]